MNSAAARDKISSLGRINFRMIVLAAVVLLFAGYPVYLYVDAAVTGGAKNTGGVWAVDLKSLGNFPFDETNGTVNDIPRKWRDLDGKKVILEGFPYPSNYAGDEVPKFQFVYNINKCCFNGPPKVQERVYAHTRDGSNVTSYFYKYASLQGTLHVNLIKENGRAVSLYDLDIDQVSPMN